MRKRNFRHTSWAVPWDVPWEVLFVNLYTINMVSSVTVCRLCKGTVLPLKVDKYIFKLFLSAIERSIKSKTNKTKEKKQILHSTKQSIQAYSSLILRSPLAPSSAYLVYIFVNVYFYLVYFRHMLLN